MTQLFEKHQSPHEIIDITDWAQQEEYSGVYGKGAREKSIVFSPNPATYDFLIPNHRYIFKQSSHRYPWQYWVEVFAYRLACLMGVVVPPAFVAYEKSQGICGALIEWFENKAMDGGDCMRQLIPHYDLKRGIQHNFKAVIETAKILEIEDTVHLWAKIFTFDSIIGNTDRHHDNWSILFALGQGFLVPKARFGPAFDNGTSMGHEILENDFEKFENPAYLKRYVERGHHHMHWSYPEGKKYNHGEFAQLFLKTFPEQKENILSCLNFSKADVESIVKELTAFKIAIPLTTERAQFMVKLVEYRKNWIYSIVNLVI